MVERTKELWDGKIDKGKKRMVVMDSTYSGLYKPKEKFGGTNKVKNLEQGQTHPCKPRNQNGYETQSQSQTKYNQSK